MDESAILWFRHGLRLHDNPALHQALQYRDRQYFYPIFIFDGETAGTKLVSYNRMKFLTESLQDLDNQFRQYGGRLHIFKNDPLTVFRLFQTHLKLKRVCFEQDCEPIWRSRDQTMKRYFDENQIDWTESVAHTLWNPFEVIHENGGQPPLTYQSFLYVVQAIGEPPRPVSDVDWSGVQFGVIPEVLSQHLMLLENVTPELLGFEVEFPLEKRFNFWIGGETEALKALDVRLKVESEAFQNGFYLPNQVNPDLLSPPTSQSAALRFGCLSVRRFYWHVHDAFKSIHGSKLSSTPTITGQLIWREYFYTMSVNNEYYAEMKRNPICLNIPWYEPKTVELERWKNGTTGYPFIDAVMRQLLIEGWIHHVARNAVACFLTRGDLWISWEYGLQHFFKYLLDADWSVCAGNWMWVSSSAFERLLDCSECICPVAFGRRLDPNGVYVKRYVPELKNMPSEYLFEPWKAPTDVQNIAKCVIGVDYPYPMVNHSEVSKRNREMMDALRDLTQTNYPPPHCRPSNYNEVKVFLGLPTECHQHCSRVSY